MELILNLLRKRYCYHRATFNDKTAVKIIDRANGNRLVAIIGDNGHHNQIPTPMPKVILDDEREMRKPGTA